MLSLKSLLQGQERKRRGLTWDEIISNDGITWDVGFPLGYWFWVVKDFGIKAYESYDLNGVEEFKLEAPAIVKNNPFIEEVYLNGVKVIQQDNYFYCDTVKFKTPYTGLLEVYYPSGRRGYRTGIYFGKDFGRFYFLVSPNLSKILFFNSLLDLKFDVRSLSFTLRFSKTNLSFESSVNAYVVCNRFLKSGKTFKFEVEAQFDLMSEYWSFYEYWNNFGEYWGR